MRLDPDKIKELYATGMTQKQIAIELNSAEGSIQAFISRHGIARSCSLKDSKNAWKTDDCVQKVKTMYSAGMTKQEIATTLGFKSVTPVNNLFAEYNITSTANLGRQRKFKLTAAELSHMYDTMSAVEIASKLGVSSSCIDKALVKHNIPVKLKNHSLPEQQVNDMLERMSVIALRRDRRVLDGMELDFVCGKIAIEVNGCYWHSESKVGKAYHVNKTNLCEAQGVQLMHFWDEEIIKSPNIVSSMIASKLGLTSRIGARSCTIRAACVQEAKHFFNTCHLQGFRPAQTYIALVHDGEIVCMASFSKPRYDKTHDVELIRYACKLNTTVVGGMSKIMKHACSGKSVISYANRRWSNGNVYEKSGWTRIKTVAPGYYYFINNKGLFHRSSFQKSKLKGWGEYRPARTEYDIMLASGHDRVWDCGQIAYSFQG